jgi:hypothetical protein
MVRAVLSEWAERVWRGVATVVLVVSLILILGLAALVVGVSQWWGLLYLVVLPVVGVLALVLLLSRGLIRHGNATETPEQEAAVNALIDKLSSAKDVAGTPKPLLALRLVFDLATKRTRYVQDVLAAAVGLRGDIAALVTLFGGPPATELPGPRGRAGRPGSWSGPAGPT